eukprot:4928-Prorocentrum_minimum.AAC.1
MTEHKAYIFSTHYSPPSCSVTFPTAPAAASFSAALLAPDGGDIFTDFTTEFTSAYGEVGGVTSVSTATVEVAAPPPPSPLQPPPLRSLPPRPSQSVDFVIKVRFCDS